MADVLSSSPSRIMTTTTTASTASMDGTGSTHSIGMMEQQQGVVSTSSSSHIDERIIAQASLDSAEEQLQSLCAMNAGTFVSVERRGRITNESLLDLYDAVLQTEDLLHDAQNSLDNQLQIQQQPTTTSTTTRQQKDQDTTTTTTRANTSSSSLASSATTRTPSLSLSILSERHRVRRRTLLQHSALLELLELPSLMDACVRSNLYDEALSIAVFSNTLERRHAAGHHHVGQQHESNSSSNNRVLSNVIMQIRSRQIDLRRHLLHRLKQNVTMPQCLEVVTALRRLNSIDLERQQSSTTTFSNNNKNQNNHNDETLLEKLHASMELQLQVDFLEARDVWLDSKNNNNNNTTGNGPTTASPASTGNSTITNPNSDATATTKAPTPVASTSEQLLDAIERYRTRVFEVATQFNAIFRTAQATTTSTSASGGSTTLSMTTTTTSSVSLLSMWTARRISTFLTLLRTHLGSNNNQSNDDSVSVNDGGQSGGQTGRMSTTTTTGDAAIVRDALEAAVFFASSMGRLGADFTSQLVPIFDNTMHDLVVRYWIDGANHFAETLRICRDARIATPLINPNMMTTTTTSTTSSSSSIDNTGTPGVGVGSSSSFSSNAFVVTYDMLNPSNLIEPMSPPRSLLFAPPLARLTNTILSGLNELRRCLLPGIFNRLRVSLDHIVLNRIRTELQTHQKIVFAPNFIRPTGTNIISTTTLPSGAKGNKNTSVSSIKKNEAGLLREVAGQYWDLYTNTFDPYIRGSLEAALGNHDGSIKHYTTFLHNIQKKQQEAEEAAAAAAAKAAEEEAAAAAAAEAAAAQEEDDDDDDGGDEEGEEGEGKEQDGIHDEEGKEGDDD